MRKECNVYIFHKKFFRCRNYTKYLEIINNQIYILLGKKESQSIKILYNFFQLKKLVNDLLIHHISHDGRYKKAFFIRPLKLPIILSCCPLTFVFQKKSTEIKQSYSIIVVIRYIVMDHELLIHQENHTECLCLIFVFSLSIFSFPFSYSFFPLSLPNIQYLWHM